MEHILCVQGVWEVVSGEEKEPEMPREPRENDDPAANSETPPAPPAPPSPTLEQDRIAYKAKVARANAVIFASMSQAIVEEHKKHKVPSVLWETL